MAAQWLPQHHQPSHHTAASFTFPQQPSNSLLHSSPHTLPIPDIRQRARQLASSQQLAGLYPGFDPCAAADMLPSSHHAQPPFRMSNRPHSIATATSAVDSLGGAVPDWQLSYRSDGQDHRSQRMQMPREEDVGLGHRRGLSSSSMGSQVSQHIIPTSSENLALASRMPTVAQSSANVSPSVFDDQDASIAEFAANNELWDTSLAARYAEHSLADIADEEVPGFVHSDRQSLSSFGQSSPATPPPPPPQVQSQGERNVKAMLPVAGEANSAKVESWTDEYLRYPGDADGSTMAALAPVLDSANGGVSNGNMEPARAIKTAPQDATFLSPWHLATPTSTAVGASMKARSLSPNYFATSAGYTGSRGRIIAPPAAREAHLHSASDSCSLPRATSPRQFSVPLDFGVDVPAWPPADAAVRNPQSASALASDYYGLVQSGFDTTALSAPAASCAPSQSSYHSPLLVAPPVSTSFLETSPLSTSESQSSFALASTIPAEFPPLLRMETSASEGGSDQPTIKAEHDYAEPDHTDDEGSVAASATSGPSILAEPFSDAGLPMGSKPASSHTDRGAYSCTYHGCTDRFPDINRLRRHKRDVHSKASGETQSGPHYCLRKRPGSDQRCNARFSRPYDLTRHEETVHNGEKKTIHCHMCGPSTMFSRADALTRHMRVKHPQVDFPGKDRRRGIPQ